MKTLWSGWKSASMMTDSLPLILTGLNSGAGGAVRPDDVPAAVWAGLLSAGLAAAAGAVVAAGAAAAGAAGFAASAGLGASVGLAAAAGAVVAAGAAGCWAPHAAR